MRCPFAEWRPLPGRDTAQHIKPRILVVHTMVGSLKGTEATFKKSVLESHFGLGGPVDGALDGVLWQWVDSDRRADAQAAGNAYCVSVETSDGGDPSKPWSERQVTALLNLGAWFAQTYKVPPRLVRSVTDSGFGYHRQFAEWNPHLHSCPGDVRQQQYVQRIIPGIAALVGGHSQQEDDVKIVKEAGTTNIWAIGAGVAKHLDGPTLAEYRKAWPEVPEPMTRAAIVEHARTGVIG